PLTAAFPACSWSLACHVADFVGRAQPDPRGEAAAGGGAGGPSEPALRAALRIVRCSPLPSLCSRSLRSRARCCFLSCLLCARVRALLQGSALSFRRTL
ncbi:unnamed protein product, partial [Closterium sp. NIES-54]